MQTLNIFSCMQIINDCMFFLKNFTLEITLNHSERSHLKKNSAGVLGRLVNSALCIFWTGKTQGISFWIPCGTLKKHQSLKNATKTCPKMHVPNWLWCIWLFLHPFSLIFESFPDEKQRIDYEYMYDWWGRQVWGSGMSLGDDLFSLGMFTMPDWAVNACGLGRQVTLPSLSPPPPPSSQWSGRFSFHNIWYCVNQFLGSELNNKSCLNTGDQISVDV